MAEFYKLTYIYNALKQGWTETWYVSANGIDGALTAAKSPSYINARLACLGDPATIEAVRVSPVDNPAMGRIEPIGRRAAAVGEADQPNAALRVTVLSKANHKRHMWLRACPDTWIHWDSIGKTWRVGENFIRPVAALVSNMAAEPVFMIRCWKKDAPIYQTGVAGGAVTKDADTGYVTVAVNGFPAPAVKAQMKKWKGLDAKYFNRTWNVIKSDPTSVTVDVVYDLLTEPDKLAGGRVVAKEYAYDDVANTVGIIEVGTRQTGRAFFVPRGRRSKRT